MSNENGDYVHPTPVTAWQLIGATISVIGLMVLAGWTIVTYTGQNIKAVADDLKANYVTTREHNDLVNRINREVARADADNNRNEREIKTVHETTLPRTEFEIWQRERTRTIDAMQKQIDASGTRIEQMIRNRASVESIAGIQKQIDQLMKQLETLAVREDQRHLAPK